MEDNKTVQDSPQTSNTPEVNAPTASSVPPAPAAPQGDSPASTSLPPVKQSKTPKLVFSGLFIIFLLIGASAAAYLGVYLPNQPDNIWKAALNNTAKGYDKLIEYEESREDFKTTKTEGTYRVEASDMPIDGKFSIISGEKQTNISFDAGIMGSRVTVDVLGEITEVSEYPDIYARVKGIKGFGDLLGDIPMQGVVESIDNKWFSVDHSLLDQVAANIPALKSIESHNQSDGYNGTEDAIKLAESIGETNRKYLFTTDETSSILNRKEYIGEETINGRSMHHFKIGLKKDNLKNYTQALRDDIVESKLYKALAENDDKVDIEDILAAIDKIDENDTADVWVDGSTKLLSKVRFTDKDNEKNYLDIGLDYTGGSEFPFYLDLHSDSTEGRLNSVDARVDVVLNTSDNTLKVDLKIDSSMIDGNFNMKLSTLTTMSNDEVPFGKPAEHTPIMELLSLSDFLGGGVSSLGGFRGNDMYHPNDTYEFDFPASNFLD